MSKGFTATELIVVLVVLGLLATLSLSRFYAYLAKGRQAEATVNLTMIGALQETWRFGHGKYNPETGTEQVGEFGASDKCGDSPGTEMKNELGFRPKDCTKLRYGYSWTLSSAIAKSSTDNDKNIYPGCTELDEWTFTYENGDLSNTMDIIKKCKD